jgi:hypothetical protein
VVRSAAELAPLPAATPMVWTSWISCCTPVSATSSCDSAERPLARLLANWALIDCDCVTSSARAEAIGSSAALSMRWLVDNCCWVRASWLCKVLSWVVELAKI